MCNSSNSKHVTFMRRAMPWLSALALAVSAHANTIANGPATLYDERHDRLEVFFQSFGCPAPHHVNEYVGAADAFLIDYRLLPVISVLESTCGIHQRLNNRWGWDSARKGFSSFRAGLEYIARQLAVGRYYRNKTLEEKVHMYNPNPQYARLVKKLMSKIDDRGAGLIQDAAAPPTIRVTYPALMLPPERPEHNQGE